MLLYYQLLFNLILTCTTIGDIVSGAQIIPRDGNSLEVIVYGLQTKKGNVITCLCGSDDFFLKDCRDQQSIAVLGQTECITLFKNIPSGEYAIIVFQDLNQNSTLDTKTIFKIPAEPFGFSNNPRILFGPPTFNQCKFKMDDKRKEIKIQLKIF